MPAYKWNLTIRTQVKNEQVEIHVYVEIYVNLSNELDIHIDIKF